MPAPRKRQPKITKALIKKIKHLLQTNTQREVGKIVGASQYFVHSIISGYYDTGKYKVPKKEVKSNLFNVNKYSCWITGRIDRTPN